MALIYCGIDEAGYGPMLGPLCVGFSAFRVAAWTPDDTAPDIWQSLDTAVCRAARDRRHRVAVADSKKLKLANTTRTRHPLIHLERGVLAFAGQISPQSVDDDADAGSPVIETDDHLFERLGVRLEDHPWYAGTPTPLPLEGSAAEHAITGNKLALACGRAGIEPVAMACIAVGESEFNEAVRTGGSKAHLTSHCFARYLRRVVERWGGGDNVVRVVCDRHGGRTAYGRMIERAVGELGGRVTTLEESDRCSRYAICLSDGAADGIHVQFRPEAEEAHFPVALASMIAKLVRELAMARLNRYWCARMPDLKPTAGYVQDARRWLGDLEGVMYDDERETMVRTA